MSGIKNYLHSNDWREVFFKTTTYAYVATLPLFLNINTIALWLFVLASVLTLKLHNALTNLKNNLSSLVPIVMLFLLYVLGLWLSKDTNRVIVDIGRTAPLVIIPFMVFMHGQSNFNIKRIFIALGVGLGIGMIICWYHIVVSILSHRDPLSQATYFFKWIYTDINLVRPLDGHPSYFAILLVIFISALLFDKHFKGLRKNKVKMGVLLAPFLLFLVETNSRIGIIVLLTIILVNAFRRMSLKLLVLAFSFLFMIGALSFKFDYLSTKFGQVVSLEGEITLERVGRWKEILNVFNEREAYVLGVGSGDARLVYRRAYYNGGYDLALKENYNAHNQYIEFLVSNGILGLVIYITVFAVFMKKTRLEANALHFAIAFILFSISETFLGRSQGVMMFSFFYAFLIVYYKPLSTVKDANK